MANLTYFGRKLEHLCSPHSSSSMPRLVTRVSHRFLLQLFYFIILSVVGYVALKVTNPRDDSFRPNDLDMFFTSMSAATVSSMSTVEMEAFSNAQLVIMTFLMFMGGEVFISTLELCLPRSKFSGHEKPVSSDASAVDQLEYGLFIRLENLKLPAVTDPEDGTKTLSDNNTNDKNALKYNSLRYLGYVIWGYLLVIHGIGVTLVSIYMSLVPSAWDVLKKKGLETETFAVFTVVSTFANCGFIPTNENMMVFNKNSGLLLILIPQILLGNTLYPSCLRLVIYLLEKFTNKQEFSYLLKNHGGYLLSGYQCLFIAATAFGFILVQFILFCAMDWNPETLNGLNPYQKFVGFLFQVVNSRHTGETIVDFSIISPAVLVLFLVMMYLPPLTFFSPAKCGQAAAPKDEQNKKPQRTFLESLILSQLSYLVIFIILICITEREKIRDDPLNFNVFNITIEVISAYGNVGYSTCYSCQRQIKPQKICEDKWYGFTGRWSAKGKVIIIFVMLFGRLKKFNQKGGRAWKLQ